MGTKEKTTIYLNGEIKRRAVDLGLNLSQVCENALGIATGSLSTAYRLLKTGSEGRGNEGGNMGLGSSSRHPSLTVKEFRRFLEVDLQLTERTVKGHTRIIARFVKWLGPRPVTREVLREYLDQFRDMAKSTYANQLKSLKVFFRDYLKMPDLVETFKFPGKEFAFKRIPEKAKLQQFYYALENLDPRAACYFLLYATSGWRFLEVFALHREDVDLEARTLTPRIKGTTTKGRLPGFFNEEAEKALRKWCEKRSNKSPKLLPINLTQLRGIWNQAAGACGFTIQPQLLRDWFCEEMGRLGVSDRYIDAFCGRVPKSVLAKHYTDYAPEKLKPIYDKAGITVLA